MAAQSTSWRPPEGRGERGPRGRGAEAAAGRPGSLRARRAGGQGQELWVPSRTGAHQLPGLGSGTRPVERGALREDGYDGQAQLVDEAGVAEGLPEPPM